MPRGLLRVAGTSLVRHQFALVRALGCQRLICIARNAPGELIALQHVAEAAGMQFHIVSTAQKMAALVTASDDLIVLAEGLMVDPVVAAPLLESGPAVLGQPVDGALAAGFERIDINNATAGALRIPGRLADRLHELPPDCDVASALIRIALQSGIPIRELPAADRARSRWAIVRNEAEAQRLERDWLRARIGEPSDRSPGALLARLGVLAFGPSLLGSGSASAMAIGIALVLLVAAGALAWFDLQAVGFFICGLAWIVALAAAMLRDAERHALGIARPSVTRAELLVWLVDVVLGLLMVAAWQAEVVGANVNSLYAPAMLVLLLHLAPRLFPLPLATWLCDRALLAGLLCIGAAAGVSATLIQALGLLLAGVGAVMATRRHG